MKQGQTREDGMVYMGLKRGKPYWSTREVYENTIECQRLHRENRREAFNNHPRTLKRGDVRSDGKVFLEYAVGAKNFEVWTTQDKLNAKRKSMKRYNDSVCKAKKNAYQRARARRLRATCPKWKMTKNVRGRIYLAFKQFGYRKNTKTARMIGCSFDKLKRHLEDRFVDGMSWDNYGRRGWHIDHIIPLASGATLEEFEALCHYTNLQPLWAKDNLSKGDRIA